MLTKKKLRKLIDTRAIEAAIKKAEKQTSGEIRVSVSNFFWGDVHAVGRKAFTRLGMANTKHRNGVLFFIVPSRRKFAVLGDVGIHQKVGQEFWENTAKLMTEKFKKGDFSGGIVAGIEEAARELKSHFPNQGAAELNELPDSVDFGDGD